MYPLDTLGTVNTILAILAGLITLAGVASGAIVGFSPYFKTQRRLIRNLRARVFVISESSDESQAEIDSLTAEGGMLSPAQVKWLAPNNLEAIGQGKAIVVFHYPKGQSEDEENPLLTEVLNMAKIKDNPVLVYAPGIQLNKLDWARTQTGNRACSTTRLRLMSDIWAAICVLPVLGKDGH